MAVNKVLGQPLKKIWSEAPANLADEPWPHVHYQEIEGSEVARIPLSKKTAVEPVDFFTIPVSDSGGLNLARGDQAWSAEIKPAIVEF